jgi:hypothetical protein
VTRARNADAVPVPTGARPGRRGPGSWTGPAAAIWALAFAAISCYWAAGGRIGEGTIGVAIEEPALAREPAFVTLLWITAVLKLLAAVLALALAGRALRWLPRWLLLAGGWATGLLLLAYGLANLVQHLLIWTGTVAMPAGLGEAALPWHLTLWDPIWIVGGVLFTLATLHCVRRGKGLRDGTPPPRATA